MKAFPSHEGLIRELQLKIALACADSDDNAPVKVLIQRVADSRFLKAEQVWVDSKQDAMVFESSTPAIDFCIDHKITDVRLWVDFGDPKYDFAIEIFRAETRALLKENRQLREKSQQLLSQIDTAQAEAKERKKQIPFKRKESGEAG